MRFADRITFIAETGGGYNPETGKHDPPSTNRVVIPCHLSRLGMDRTNQLFGVVDKVVTVARLQRPYTERFTSVSIDDEPYKVLRKSDYRKGVLFLERGQ